MKTPDSTHKAESSGLDSLNCTGRLPDKAQHEQPNIATLATACSCGGPGGRPGMKPVCLSCFRFHKLVTAAVARQAACQFTARGDADMLELTGAS